MQNCAGTQMARLHVYTLFPWAIQLIFAQCQMLHHCYFHLPVLDTANVCWAVVAGWFFRNLSAFPSPQCVGDVNITPLPFCCVSASEMHQVWQTGTRGFSLLCDKVIELMPFVKYFGACSHVYPLCTAVHFRSGGRWRGTARINAVMRVPGSCYCLHTSVRH